MTDYKRWGKCPSNPDHLYQVPGTGIEISHLDLLRTGEMLEAERELGTREAAKLFQPGPGGHFTWGLNGEGDISLPMYNGRHVDIDWLNTLMRFGVVGYSGYATAKLGWTVIDGFKILFSGGGLSGFKDHWNAYFSAEEQNAVEMARAVIFEGAELRGILHPELVRMAEDCLLQYRRQNEQEFNYNPSNDVDYYPCSDPMTIHSSDDLNFGYSNSKNNHHNITNWEKDFDQDDNVETQLDLLRNALEKDFDQDDNVETQLDLLRNALEKDFDQDDNVETQLDLLRNALEKDFDQDDNVETQLEDSASYFEPIINCRLDNLTSHDSRINDNNLSDEKNIIPPDDTQVASYGDEFIQSISLPNDNQPGDVDYEFEHEIIRRSDGQNPGYLNAIDKIQNPFTPALDSNNNDPFLNPLGLNSNDDDPFLNPLGLSKNDDDPFFNPSDQNLLIKDDDDFVPFDQHVNFNDDYDDDYDDFNNDDFYEPHSDRNR